MTLAALDDIDDALDATRAFLWPIDRTTWVKLAVVVFFLGSPGVNLNSFQYSMGDGQGVPAGPIETGLGPGAWAWIAVAVLVLLAIALVFAVVAAVMEFVFVESLRAETVTVRRYWGRRWRQGLRLFGFRLALGLVVLGSVLLLAIPFVLSMLDGAGGPDASALALFLGFLPFVLLLGLVVATVDGFTTLFVVPIMILEDVGVLDGWRRLWPTITRDWTQYLAFLVAWFFLTLITGVLLAILTVVAALALLVLFGIFFGIGVALFVGGLEAAGIAVLVVVGVAYGLTVIAAAVLLQVPVQTYLRYYALLVLGDVEADFDVVPDRRAAIRAEAAE